MPIKIPFSQLRCKVSLQLPLSFFFLLILNIGEEFLDVLVFFSESGIELAKLLQGHIFVEITVFFYTFRIYFLAFAMLGREDELVEASTGIEENDGTYVNDQTYEEKSKVEYAMLALKPMFHPRVVILDVLMEPVVLDII